MRLLWFIGCMFLGGMMAHAQHTTDHALPHHRHIEVPGLREKGGQLFQDQDGFVYLLQPHQVLRFDGISWDKYEQRNSELTYSSLTFFKNSLWIGTREGTLLKAKGDSLLPYALEEGWPTKAITAMLATHEWLFVATAGEGLYAFNGHRLLLIDQAGGLPDNVVTSLAMRKGELLVGTDMGLIALSIDTNYKKKIKQISNEPLISAIFTADTAVWLGFQSGEFGVWQHGKMTFLPSGDEDPVSEIVPVNQNWWYHDKSGHLHQYMPKKGKTVHLHFQKGDRNARIVDMLADKDGNIWLSTDLGIFLVHPHWQLMSFGLEIQVQALGKLGNGALVAGTNKGCYVWDEERGWSALTFSGQLPNVLCFAPNKRGGLWVGTFGQGLYEIDAHARLSAKVPVNGIDYNTNIFSIEPSKEENTWYLGTLGGIYELKASSNQTQIKGFHHGLGPGQFYIFDLLMSRKGVLWVATDGKGIFTHQNDRFEAQQIPNTSSSLIISALSEGVDGSVWASSPQGQLYRWKKGQWEQFHIPFEHTISLLHATRKGHILMGSQNGLSLFQPGKRLLLQLDKMHDLPVLSFTGNALLTDSDTIWLGANGLVMKTSTSQIDKIFQPRVKLSQPFSTRRTNLENKGHAFDADDNNLRFYFQIPWFYEAGMLFIRYKLHGLHTQWMETEKREIFLQGLEPGTYTLEVQVSLHRDFRSFHASKRSFEVNKPYYSTWWFLLLVTVAVALMLRQVIRWREQRKILQDRAEKERIRAQYEILKSQISPHFLFNAFNTLSQLIEIEPKKASKYVEQLSELFRKVLHFRDQQVITLGEEMQLVNAFVHLQQQRFENKFDVRISIPKASEQSLVIPMSVQLLVESAVKHNVISAAHPLLIEIFVRDGFLVVRNKIRLKKTNEPSTGFGLSSLSSRYEQDFNQSVEIKRDDSFFTVSIPMLNP
mgnify:CR=1 FL=1